MVRYIARRFLFIVLVTVAIVYFVFLSMHLIARIDAGEAAVSMRTTMQLASQDMLTFFDGLVRGDLGEVPTISGDRPVNDILWTSYVNSMGLVVVALAGAALLGLLFGTLAALVRHRRWADLILLLTILGISIPSFLVAVVLQNAGILYRTTFGSRIVSMGGFGWDVQHMLLPVLVLAARPIAYITRAAYLSLGEILDEDFVRTAVSKGLRPQRTLFVHAYRNLAVPVLTAVGVSLRFTLSSLPIVELLFAWPGVGLRALEAINERIPLLVVVIALVLGLTIQVVNLLLDFTYQLADPRLRGQT